MQTGEIKRCTEVTILNLIDYYANSYNDYRSIISSEIHNSEKKYNHKSVLPFHGIGYLIFTKVLTDFGFSLRLYNLFSISKILLIKYKSAGSG